MRFETVLSYYSLKTLEDKKMKKLSIVGGILFALGMLVATGIDMNPVQAIYALALVGAAACCFYRAERQKHNTKSIANANTADYQKAA